MMIELAAVRQAVLALHTMKPIHSPLFSLRLVADVLADPDFPRSHDERHYALNLVLTASIRQGFHQQRAVLDRPLPLATETFLEARAAIHTDSLLDNSELLAWGWLYYHFVRVDLGIGVKVFCNAASITSRTLRRYQQTGFVRLTYALRQQEYAARRQ